jgi:hypothetical protein
MESVFYNLIKSNNTGAFHYVPATNQPGCTITDSKGKEIKALKEVASQMQQWLNTDAHDLDIPEEAPKGMALPVELASYPSVQALQEAMPHLPSRLEWNGQFKDNGTPILIER